MLPAPWTGNDWVAPGIGGSPNSTVRFSASSSCAVVAGSRGKRRLGVVPRALVKSPTVLRRQAVRFGLTTPVTSSSSRITDVWSNVSWQT